MVHSIEAGIIRHSHIGAVIGQVQLKATELLIRIGLHKHLGDIAFTRLHIKLTIIIRIGGQLGRSGGIIQFIIDLERTLYRAANGAFTVHISVAVGRNSLRLHCRTGRTSFIAEHPSANIAGPVSMVAVLCTGRRLGLGLCQRMASCRDGNGLRIRILPAVQGHGRRPRLVSGDGTGGILLRHCGNRRSGKLIVCPIAGALTGAVQGHCRFRIALLIIAGPHPDRITVCMGMGVRARVLDGDAVGADAAALP